MMSTTEKRLEAILDARVTVSYRGSIRRELLELVADVRRDAFERLRPYVAHHALSCNVNNQQAWDEAMEALTDVPPEVRSDPGEMYAIECAQAEATAKRVKCTCGFDEVVAGLDQQSIGNSGAVKQMGPFQVVDFGRTMAADAYVTVNFEALALELGRRAAGNKGRKCTLRSGSVVVEVCNIRKAEEQKL